MNMYDIIYKKREGGVLSREEIDYFVEGYTAGEIPDYQASALLMAIFFQKLNHDETFLLTDAMRCSGETADLSAISGIKVDKHSTGGVGDKTTLVAAPLAAACGVSIAKMSGRGLGFTGGTIDKLESIPGFSTVMDPGAFRDQVNRIGISVIGQTAHIAAADKKIYALRDVTATVENRSLITSSIMSKKLASGSDAIVLDVKCGSGAFMEQFDDACQLGQMMVDIGLAAGKRTVALITDMTQPLGRAVGNSLEVIEAIETLKGKGPEDITELSLTLAAYMVYVGGQAQSPQEGRALVETVWKNGQALDKLRRMISAQGGEPGVIEDYSLFPQGTLHTEALAEEEGFVSAIQARFIGLASQHLGAGREKKEDSIDLSAGMVLQKKVGDPVAKGEALAVLTGSSSEKMQAACLQVQQAFSISREAPTRPLLIQKVLQG